VWISNLLWSLLLKDIIVVIYSQFFPGSDMGISPCVASILARLASMHASCYVASSEASQGSDSHPPNIKLAHETRASLRVFSPRVVLVATVYLALGPRNTSLRVSKTRLVETRGDSHFFFMKNKYFEVQSNQKWLKKVIFTRDN